MRDSLLFDTLPDGRTVPREELPHFDSPRDDNQRLLNYQYDWLVHRNPEAWENLWLLSCAVARRMIMAMARKKGFHLSPGHLQDKVENAVIYILRRYDYGWYVKKAFLKAIKEAVVHALWYRTKAQRMETLLDNETISRIMRAKDEEDGIIYVEGMTTSEAIARIRAELLPEIADRLLENIQIIGEKMAHKVIVELDEEAEAILRNIADSEGISMSRAASELLDTLLKKVVKVSFGIQEQKNEMVVRDHRGGEDDGRMELSREG